MELTPLPGKVLIQPDPVRQETDSGLLLVEHWPMEVSGVVVAVGSAKHPRQHEALEVAAALEVNHVYYPTCAGLDEAAQLLRELTGREPAVAVGDRVLFGLSAGREIRIEDTRYFLMDESDLLAVVPPESDVAA